MKFKILWSNISLSHQLYFYIGNINYKREREKFYENIVYDFDEP